METFIDLDKHFHELTQKSTNKYIKALRLFQIEIAIRLSENFKGPIPPQVKKMTFPVHVYYDCYRRLSALICADLLAEIVKEKTDVELSEARPQAQVKFKALHFISVYKEFVAYKGWRVVSRPGALSTDWETLKKRQQFMEAVAAPIDISLRLEKDPWSPTQRVTKASAIELLSRKDTKYRELFKVKCSIETIERHWPDYKRVSIFCYLAAHHKFSLGLPEEWSIYFTPALMANAQRIDYIRGYVAKYNEFQTVLAECGYRVPPVSAKVGEPKAPLEIDLRPLTAELFAI